ncbi:MAG: FAD-dependent oxidoreductase [Thermoproteota archaeon]
MVAENVMEVAFELDGSSSGGSSSSSSSSGSSHFPFRPGQYVSVTLPSLAYPDSRGRSRSFNMVNSPNNSKYLYFAFVVREQSGFKRTLAEAPIGTNVGIRGPYGMFTLPEGDRDFVMVASGIGVTACLSIAIYAAEMQLGQKITMLYNTAPGEGKTAATATATAMPYVKELQQLKGVNPNFDVRFASGAGGIDQSLIKRSVEDPKSRRWLVAGSPGQTGRVRSTLLKMGVPVQAIRTEDFTGY